MTVHPLRRRDSWQEYRIDQRQAPSCFVVCAPASDPALVELIASGLHVPVPRRVSAATAVDQALLALAQPLLAELTKAVSCSGGLAGKNVGESVLVFCHAAAVDHPAARVGLLCSLTETNPSWLPESARERAGELLAQYRARVARSRACEALTEIDLAGSRPDACAVRDSEGHSEAATVARNPPEPIRPDVASLLSVLLPGVVARVSDGNWVDGIGARISKIHDKQHPPPRDGLYQAVVALANPAEPAALVSWVPHRGTTPYSEVRGAVLHRVPAAFARPRSSALITAAADLSLAGTFVLRALDPLDSTWEKAFAGVELGSVEHGGAAQRAREKLDRRGLDAIGWYQPHHEYCADTWGIYVDAAGLDELACSISEGLSALQYGRRDDGLAALMAFMMVFQHQYFHAKVESVLTWLEVQALRPKYRPYLQKVVAQVVHTDDALEEALATYWAWTWIVAETAANQTKGRYSLEGALAIRNVVQEHLDRAPPGQRRWREGANHDLWSTLGTQMVHARTKLGARAIPLPLEQMLRDALPFECAELKDVPCRFVGSGRISGTLKTLCPSPIRSASARRA